MNQSLSSGKRGISAALSVAVLILVAGSGKVVEKISSGKENGLGEAGIGTLGKIVIGGLAVGAGLAGVGLYVTGLGPQNQQQERIQPITKAGVPEDKAVQFDEKFADQSYRWPWEQNKPYQSDEVKFAKMWTENEKMIKDLARVNNLQRRNREWDEAVHNAAYGDEDGNKIQNYTEFIHGLNPLVKEPGEFVEAFHLLNSGDGSLVDDLVSTFHNGDSLSSEEKKFLKNLTETGDSSPAFAKEITSKYLNDNQVSDFEASQIKVFKEAPEDYKNAIIEENYLLKPDWDKDGWMNRTDNQPFKPDDRDQDGILDRFYNANMNRSFDNGDKVG